jgi:hypothetical protein
MKSLRELWKSFKIFSKGREAKYTSDSYKDEEGSTKRRVDNKKRTDTLGQVIRQKQKKAHLQVGLDFGTSATKVVYSQLGRRVSRVINFNHNLPNYPNYCLPSLGAIDDSGKLLLGIEAAKFLSDKEWDLGLQRFKVIVAGNHDLSFKDHLSHEKFYAYIKSHGCDAKFTPERLTAIYIAYTMNRCRSIIERLPEYRDAELDIAFNICMPIDHIENNILNSVFEKVFSLAERIEQDWRKSSKDFDPLGASYDLENKSHELEKRVFAVPEAVAAMASYIISLAKEEGLHAIIDLGAGTTDVSICNLSIPSGESISYWYAARNIPKGTINIERIIASFIKEYDKSSLCTCCDVYNYLNDLKLNAFNSVTSDENSKQLNTSLLDEIGSMRNSKEYYQTWGSAYNRLRKETEWEKVEIFLCGGGANLPYVEDVFSHPWWQNLQVKYLVSRLPVPDDYDPGESAAPFERMAVAYGLARPSPEFEDYVLPAEVGDHTPPPLPVKELDHEELYPK